MPRTREDIGGVSTSFLDLLSCGMGATVILLVIFLSRIQPQSGEKSTFALIKIQWTTGDFSDSMSPKYQVHPITPQFNESLFLGNTPIFKRDNLRFQLSDSTHIDPFQPWSYTPPTTPQLHVSGLFEAPPIPTHFGDLEYIDFLTSIGRVLPSFPRTYQTHLALHNLDRELTVTFKIDSARIPAPTQPNVFISHIDSTRNIVRDRHSDSALSEVQFAFTPNSSSRQFFYRYPVSVRIEVLTSNPAHQPKLPFEFTFEEFAKHPNATTFEFSVRLKPDSPMKETATLTAR